MEDNILLYKLKTCRPCLRNSFYKLQVNVNDAHGLSPRPLPPPGPPPGPPCQLPPPRPRPPRPRPRAAVKGHKIFLICLQQYTEGKYAIQ